MSEPLSTPAAEPFTQPVFESFTVWVAAGSDPATMGERAEQALRSALERVGASTAGWRPPRAVHASQPGMYDLQPPAAGALSVEQAWEATYALIDDPSIVDAEPSFEILQDNGDALTFEREEEPDGEVTPVVEIVAVEAVAGEGGVAAAVVAAPAALPPPTFSKSELDWCPKLIDAPGAWALVPPPFADGSDGRLPGRAKGEGIVVGHPDAGFRQHREIIDVPTSRVLDNRGFDLVDDNPSSDDPQGGHGLGTASVLMSAVGGPDGNFVTGVAPAAELVPFRVTKPHLFFPAPVLFSSGMSRLGDAIFRAVDAGCHVISISLGWLPNEKVRRAVQHAVERDVIVVAAAGNQVRFVVWPAHYDEVISCAGCTSRRRRWSGSSRGRRVDVTGPAEDVWKAAIDDGQQTVEQSNGTSFAAASVAGLAALWLAFWGRARLLARYQGEFRLATVFRELLLASVDPPPAEADGDFGRGIVNARRLLEQPLPTRDELRATAGPSFAVAALAAAEPTAIAGMRPLAEAFDDVPRERLQADVAALLAVPAAEVPARLQGVGRELTFHVLTNPAAREALLAAREAPQPLAPAAPGEAAAAMAEARPSLLDQPLSARLRGRL
jgi:thermitase